MILWELCNASVHGGSKQAPFTPPILQLRLFYFPDNSLLWDNQAWYVSSLWFYEAVNATALIYPEAASAEGWDLEPNCVFETPQEIDHWYVRLLLQNLSCLTFWDVKLSVVYSATGEAVEARQRALSSLLSVLGWKAFPLPGALLGNSWDSPRLWMKALPEDREWKWGQGGSRRLDLLKPQTDPQDQEA